MKKGISLIVLVITILVIIVLAGAVILTVVTNNPLEKANEGIFKSDLKTFEQELNLAIGDVILNQETLEDGSKITPKDINASGTDMLKYIKSMKNKEAYLATLQIKEGQLIYIGEEGQYDKELAWAQQIGIKTLNVPLEITDVKQLEKTTTTMKLEVVVNKNNKVRGYMISIDGGATYTAEQTSNTFDVTGLSEGKEYKVKAQIVDVKGKIITSNEYILYAGLPPHKDPFMPTGFEYVTGTWNYGYVIKDKKLGNEFVWIPVPYINQLVMNATWGQYVGVEKIPDNIKASITKYGGFYRSRYEIGKGNVSIKDKDAWNNITTTDAISAANTMYNTEEIASSLQYSAMWDLTVIWISNTAKLNIRDSRSWGNYYNDYMGGNDGIKQTGSNESWKANNIYDLAGNVSEFTYEIYGSAYNVSRGGNFWNSGNYSPATYRFTQLIGTSDIYAGFSTILYKK